MPKPKLSDAEIKADIMNRLMRKNCWGAKYLPLDSLVNWLAKRVERNGRRVRKIIKILVNQGCLILHKGGKTVSLNLMLSGEIVKYVERVIEKR